MSSQHIQVGDRTRTFDHFAPSIPRAGAPLLLALHGTTQTQGVMRTFSGKTLDALAERIGADLVYLGGYHRAWNDARLMQTSAAQRKNIDDVGFVRTVVELFGRPTIAIGYSNGGQLLHRVLRETSGLLAGAAMIGAGLPADDNFTLVGVAPDPVPVLLFHGTADPVVPYAGGVTRLLGRARGSVISARATAESYAPDVDPAVSRDGEIERADWGSVRLVSQHGVGHVIPNRLTAPRFVGLSHHDLDVGEEIEEFFALQIQGESAPAELRI
jgi:polyhydroxybutyrate depolymerase